MRSLVTDLGDAYCEELERTAIGPFRLEDADPERLVPLRDALAFLPERVLSAEEARAVGHGQRVALRATAPRRGRRPGEAAGTSGSRTRVSWWPSASRRRARCGPS